MTISNAADQLYAAAGRYTIDPSSRIGFNVGQIGGGRITGTFPSVTGSFDIDPQSVGRSFVTITLRPASVTTGQSRIDAFLRSNAVFDAADHPEITFRSSRVVQDSPTSATIKGVLNARGRSRTETFHASLIADHGGRIAFHVVGDIYRSPYGMDVGTPIYSNVVRFDMVLKGVR